MNAVDLNSSSHSPSSQGSLSALFDVNMPCERFVEANEKETNFLRSAAVMVFNGKIEQAIKCLQEASDSLAEKANDSEEGESISLNVIALALSAYEASSKQKEEDFMWKKTCKNLKAKLKDPYIKAIFIFLSMNGNDEISCNEIIVSSNDSFTAFLHLTFFNLQDNVNLNLDIADKIGFACMFLSDYHVSLNFFFLKHISFYYELFILVKKLFTQVEKYPI